MNTFEITCYRAQQKGLLSKSVAQYLIDKALKCFSSEAYNAVIDEYVNILKEDKCKPKKKSNTHLT